MNACPAALATRGLTKSYFGNRVVRDVNLTVRRGEVYGLVGPNGAGKSTLMKLVCGFVLPTSGTVEVLGERLAPGASHPLMGSLIERPGLYASMTGRENLRCRAYALGLPHPRPSVERAVEMVGLGDAADENASSYSLGMRQRVGIALALLGNPELLVLDEPFNGIDVEGTRQLRRVIQGLCEQSGVTVVVSSHVVDQLARFATRYGIMRKGRIVAEKTAEDVERSCEEYLSVRVGSPERAVAVLRDVLGAGPAAGMSPTAGATPPAVAEPLLCADGEIRIPLGVIEVPDLTRLLVGARIDVEEVSVHRADVEDYFAELMEGGGGHGQK